MVMVRVNVRVRVNVIVRVRVKVVSGWSGSRMPLLSSNFKVAVTDQKCRYRVARAAKKEQNEQIS